MNTPNITTKFLGVDSALVNLTERKSSQTNSQQEFYTGPEILNSTGDIVFVSSKEDFPTASAGVITLVDNVTYFILSAIDLTGDRLVGGSNTTLIGGSSENCTLTSTGLNASTALLTTEYTTPIREIAIKDVGTGFAIDGNARTVALDWTGVNFVNVPNVGSINTCDNFIFTKGAFINSGGLSVTGTIGTCAFNSSLFECDSANTLFDLQAGLTITRRFRIIYSSLIILSGETGISLNASATIPTQGIILDTCNFAGGGAYLSGIDYQDNKALFRNNVGIINSREISQYYMSDNVTATTVLATGTTYKVAGTTTGSSLTSKFTNTDNRATYIGDVDRIFTVTAAMSLSSGNNNKVGVYIAKNGVVLPDSEIYITTNSAGRVEGASVQVIVELSTDDYVEIFVENDTAIANITVSDMSVIVK